MRVLEKNEIAEVSGGTLGLLFCLLGSLFSCKPAAPVCKPEPVCPPPPPPSCKPKTHC